MEGTGQASSMSIKTDPWVLSEESLPTSPGAAFNLSHHVFGSHSTRHVLAV
jgi:hypothetical protein